MVSVLALRGYLPDAEKPPPRPSVDGTGALVAMLVIAALAVLVAAVALVAMLVLGPTRRPGSPAPTWVGHRPAPGQWWRGVAWFGFAGLVVVAALALAPNRNRASTPDPDRGTTDPNVPAVAPLPAPRGGEIWPDILLVLPLLVALLLAGAVARARLMVSARDAAREEGADTVARRATSESLQRAAELGLVEVSNAGADPRAAIIACYLAMERGLREAPDAAPLESDTPTEVLARAVHHGALHRASATALVGLFEEARFSGHEMTERHRDTAATLLRSVLAELRETRCAASP
ncbi:DUF4129 domain-containing protein [Rhodococcus sp. NPDC058514]|uniref:DUF4129 domain-containing protein n=1 Tax=unclassified Rhodococcus (in: high G+C Gram-positive bacteria) TaxID=192944 RepID=UPI00365C955C